jgi:3-deoxy-D-arabino-heptulosonate 7-phosphate (DAHP) synthase
MSGFISLHRQQLDAGCTMTDACIQNLKTLAAMHSLQTALPDYSLSNGPDYSSKEAPQ